MMFMTDVPLHSRADGCRVVEPLPCLLPHEIICDEYRDNTETIRHAFATTEFPVGFTEHPVTQACRLSGTFAWPLALYVDGVKFAREDTANGWWLVDLITGRRWSLCNMRKSQLCQCGCKGWCSIYPIMLLLGWSCRALVAGVHPSRGHTGLRLDDMRESVGNSAMPCRGVIMYIKGDWMEFATTLAFPSWADVNCPCPRCWCTHDTLFSTRGLSALGTPFPQKTFAQYERACDACERKIAPLSDALYRKIRASLMFDRKKDGARGRVLAVDIPEAGLLRGDRLEPSVDCVDICDGFNESKPESITFWRRSFETLTRHRNPLFCGEAHITPEECLAFDYLHGLALGVYKSFMAHMTWCLLRNNVWGAPPHDNMDTRVLVSVPRLRLELFAWYKRERTARRQHCEVQDLTPAMLGSLASPSLGLHGAETVSYLAFGGHLLQRYGAAMGAERASIEAAWAALNRIRVLTSTYPRVLPMTEVQPFVEATCDAIRFMQLAGVPQRPKLHALIEIAYLVRRFGSPALFACWDDESKNVLLRDAARGAHRSNWHWRVLRSLNESLNRDVRARRA